MASTETTSTPAATADVDVNVKTVEESGGVPPPPQAPPSEYYVVSAQFGLRLLLLACSITALLLLVTSKQTKLVPVTIPGILQTLFISREAKFQNTPALIYLLVALSVTALYTIITLLVSLSAILKTSPSTNCKILFLLLIFDALVAGVMASATGTAASVAYVGLKGNSHANWNKICNIYGKFCRYAGSSVAISLAASIILILLVFLSAHSLYLRTH